MIMMMYQHHDTGFNRSAGFSACGSVLLVWVINARKAGLVIVNCWVALLVSQGVCMRGVFLQMVTKFRGVQD